MPIINVSLPADGTVADVADINNPISTIVTLVNGNLDSANLADNAVSTTKLASGSVTSEKLAIGALNVLAPVERKTNATTGATSTKVPYNGFSGSYTFQAVQNKLYQIFLHEPNLNANTSSNTMLIFPTINGSVVGTMPVAMFHSTFQYNLNQSVYWKATFSGTATLTLQFSSAGGATAFTLGASDEQKAQLLVNLVA